jgi:trans-aconitate methyltransferase
MLKGLIKFVKDKAGITQNAEALKKLEAKVQAQHNFLLSWQQLTANEQVAVNEQLGQTVSQRLQARFKLKPFTTAIHKNDVMLAYHLYKNAPNATEGLESYYRVGIRAVQALAQVASQQGWQPQTILDFGSGYGRMSRFLPQAFPGASVIPTEVKPEAMAFQEQTFGFKGVTHGSAPDGFQPPASDLIIALSVFSHLPEGLTKKWLPCLLQSLNPGGALVFTYHALEEQPHLYAQSSSYAFVANSEDSLLPITADYLENTQEYGVSFYSRTFLEAYFSAQGWRFLYLENKLAPTQKAYALWK